MEKAKEVATEVKDAAVEVAAGLHPKAQLSSLREVVDGVGFDEKRGWRRVLALWSATNSPFLR
jgi:hypothetical protein